MKFCTCDEKKPRGSASHKEGCNFFKVRPETKDEKISRLEARLHEVSASEILLHALMNRPDVPVEVSVETYDNPPQTVTVKVWSHRRDDGIVWDGCAQWLGKWKEAMAASHHYYLRDLGSRANAVYEKYWSGK